MPKRATSSRQLLASLGRKYGLRGLAKACQPVSASTRDLRIRVKHWRPSHNGTEEATMTNPIETRTATGLDSPLHLWIAIWQRQLVSARG